MKPIVSKICKSFDIIHFFLLSEENADLAEEISKCKIPFRFAVVFLIQLMKYLSKMNFENVHNSNLHWKTIQVIR